MSFVNEERNLFTKLFTKTKTKTRKHDLGSAEEFMWFMFTWLFAEGRRLWALKGCLTCDTQKNEYEVCGIIFKEQQKAERKNDFDNIEGQTATEREDHSKQTYHL